MREMIEDPHCKNTTKTPTIDGAVPVSKPPTRGKKTRARDHDANEPPSKAKKHAAGKMDADDDANDDKRPAEVTF